MVVDKTMTSLLRARSIQQLSLITVRYDNILQVMQTESHKTVRESQSSLTLGQIMHQYKEVFDGDLEALPGQLHLEVDTSIKPVPEPVRRVLLAIQETLMKELAYMEKTGVIKK